MERYVRVDSMSDIKDMCHTIKIIGQGSEGQVFLIKGNKILKLHNGFDPIVILDKDIHNIIMKQDVDTKSFFFPETIFIIDGVVAGYITSDFGESIEPFNCSHLKPGEDIHYDFSSNNLKRINFEKIFDAREKLMRDIYILSEQNILASDVTFNLLYNGKMFGVIDTLGFKKVDYNPLLKNVDLINNAILNEFDLYDKNFHPNFKESLERNIQRIRMKR